MNDTWSSGFMPEDEAETELLEASAGFSLLEEEPDNSEALRVLDRQWDTLQVKLDNLADSLERLEQQAPPPQAGQPRQQWEAQRDNLADQMGRLEGRLAELEAQIRQLGGR